MRLGTGCLAALAGAAALVSVVGCGAPTAQPLDEQIVGSWAAFRQSTPVNMWSFYNDRTCENTGWMDVPGEQSSETRVFVVAGRYEISADVITVIIEDVSGDSVLTSDYRPALNNSVLVFHDVIVDRDRLLYNNPNGMPVVYRREN